MSTKILTHAEQTGQLEGEVCGRDGCAGVISEREVENCSCHISPPCGSCTEPREYCPVCDWEATEDEVPYNDFLVRPASPVAAWSSYRPRPLDPTKIDWRSSAHTNSSMKKEGVYPYGTTTDQLRQALNGTFGGRFERHREATQEKPGSFTFIAYTD